MTSATKDHIATQVEIDDFMAHHQDWNFEDNRLKAHFKFETFEQAIKVINAVAQVARDMDHHPAIFNVYDQLTFSLCTHSLGDVVTTLDFQLAERISDIVAAGKK